MLPTPAISGIDLSPLTLPPALQAQFDGAIDLVIVETVFPTLLIPIAVCLFMFTNPEIRRKPIFVLNVMSIMLGLVFGGITIATVVRRSSPDLVTATNHHVVSFRLRTSCQPQLRDGRHRALLLHPYLRSVHPLC